MSQVITQEQALAMQAEIARLRQEQESLKAAARSSISFKVSAKGALSVYGMGRFPITLYKEQWLKLLDLAVQLKTFIRENDSLLKSK